MTKCLFNALLFTVMEIVFPALLHPKSGSVTLTLFWARLCRCISHYDSQIKTFCWHSSRAFPRAGSADGSPAQRDGDGPAGSAISWDTVPRAGQAGRGHRNALGWRNRAAERLCPPGAQQPWLCSLLTPLPSQGSREWSASGFSQRCEIQAEGGSGLEGWRQILLLPKDSVQKFLLNKWSASGGSGWGRKKHIKGVMKRKQSTLFRLRFAFPSLHSRLPKQSLSCSWPSKLE